jgi:hypothetical protein
LPGSARSFSEVALFLPFTFFSAKFGFSLFADYSTFRLSTRWLARKSAENRRVMYTTSVGYCLTLAGSQNRL